MILMEIKNHFRNDGFVDKVLCGLYAGLNRFEFNINDGSEIINLRDKEDTQDNPTRKIEMGRPRDNR